jgi:Arc/MetJ family transcription regulator
MRTTLDIDASLLDKVQKATGATSKKKAIEKALEEFLRNKRRMELIELIGNWDDFALSLEELQEMRKET